jgi:hypothetical protein
MEREKIQNPPKNKGNDEEFPKNLNSVNEPLAIRPFRDHPKDDCR